MIRSIRNRIALWHVVMFTAMSLISFFLIYQLLERFLLQRNDQLLIERVKRNEWYGKDELKATLDGHIDYWMSIEGTQTVLYLVFDTQGNVFACPSGEEWQQFRIDPRLIMAVRECIDGHLEAIREQFPQMVIVKIEDCPGITHVFFENARFLDQNFRVCYARLVDGKVLMCAQSLSLIEQFLQQLRETFWWLFGITVFLGGIAGLFLAEKSVSGLKKVTKIAGEIERGNFEHRLDPKGEGLEIENLAERFNAMLDKIQALLTTLSNVSDDIAHDLRTPITRIRGTAELALTAKYPDPQTFENALCSIVEECDRLVVMIRTMLEIAQTDAGILELQLETVDIWQVLRTGYELFLSLAEDKGIQLELKLPETVAVANVHVGRMQRAVANLLDNAIKFTGSGGRVEIMGETTENQIIIRIQDTGIGIPVEEQERVFDRFYRRDPSRTIEGNGLGLCLAKAIVQAHRGTISLSSEVGKGSCFTITIPQRI